MNKPILVAISAVLLSLVAFIGVVLAQAITYPAEFTTPGTEYEQALARLKATAEGNRIEAFLQGNGIPITITLAAGVVDNDGNPAYGLTRPVLNPAKDKVVTCEITLDTDTGGVVELADTLYHEMRHCEIFKTFNGTNAGEVNTANCGVCSYTDGPYTTFRAENAALPTPTPGPSPTPSPTPSPPPVSCPNDASILQPTPTPTPSGGGGGIAEPIVLGSDSAADTPASGTGRDYTLPAAAAAGLAGVLAVAAGGWYARRRLS